MTPDQSRRAVARQAPPRPPRPDFHTLLSRADFVNISLWNITVILDDPTLRHTVISRSSPMKGREVITLTRKTTVGGDGVGGTTALSGLVIAVAVFMSGTAIALVH